MSSRLALAAPVASALLGRLLQLVVLAVLVATTTGKDEATLVTGFALVSAFAIFTDSGAAAFLLARTVDEAHRALFLRVLGLHAALAAAGACASVALTLGSADSSRSWAVVLVMVGLALSQLGDSVTRTARAVQLVHRRDARYARTELLVVAAKLPVLAVVVVTAHPELLALLVVPSLVVCAMTIRTNAATCPVAGPAPRGTTLRVLEYGVSGSLSAFYSQAPLLIGTAMLGVTAVAPLALAYRVVQPLEVVPATVSQQLIPRVRALRQRLLAVWAAFVAVGTVAVAVVVALVQFVGPRLEVTALVAALFVPVSLYLAPKFGNYALVAVAMGLGFIRQRLVATVVVGIVTVTACLVAGARGDVSMLAWVAVGAECLLLVVLATALRLALRTSKEPT